MPDENRFAGLGEQVEEKDSELLDEDEEPREPNSTSDTDDEANNQPTTEEQEGGPAFGFDATVAKSVYVREETLELLEDTEFEVESVLRREHDIRDVTGREFHDAIVHVITDHIDEVASRIQVVREGE